MNIMTRTAGPVVGSEMEKNRHRSPLALILLALATLVMVLLIAPKLVTVRGAQSLDSDQLTNASTVRSVLLSRGEFRDPFTIIKIRAPIDVAEVALTFPPGTDTGWHYHPGPAIVIVKSGTITRYLEDGCRSVYPAGSVFVEEENHVHLARNEGTDVARTLAMFIVPHGSATKIAAPNPGTTCQEEKER
jgi:quercetin dioxygenase-like cupin family protein